MIYIATHKECAQPENSSNFQRIWLGKESVPKGYISDKKGNNFFNIQKNFAEVSALFSMASKNDKIFQGLFHYRRYFAFDRMILNKIMTEKEFDKYILDYKIPNHIFRKIDEGKIIRPRKVSYYHSIHNCLCKILSVDDLKILYSSIMRIYPGSMKQVEKYMFYNNKMSCCNIFIANPDFTKSYINWVTPIFTDMLKFIKVSPYSVPSRIFGFLSEALMDIFIIIKKFKTYEVPLLIGRNDIKHENLFIYFMKEIRNNISHNINKPINFSYENYS